MKDQTSVMTMRITLITIAMLIIAVMSFFFFTNYRSAFEADQACHFANWVNYKGSPEFGCDHDIETRQWILYEEGANHQPAKVIERFRY